MKRFARLLGIAAIATLIGFSMTGCVTAIEVEEPVETAMIQPVQRDFTILGVLQFEQDQRFEITYSFVLTEARRLFPAANAVIDVRIEPIVRTGLFGAQSMTFAVSGIVIQYVLEPAAPPQ
ncbi:MAG: hypothetical protein FWG66_10545 [Spirochaetes bacterium]|nr:hypothetical protein [Spirochaetota bacterium]